MLGPGKGSSVYWSPYQKLTLIAQQEADQAVGYSLNTNGTWYQQIVDLSPNFVASHPEFFKTESVEWNPYNIPYHFCPQPVSVLVLGAGMGNDVAAALRNGARRVVAVEIDPLILKLGREVVFRLAGALLLSVHADEASGGHNRTLPTRVLRRDCVCREFCSGDLPNRSTRSEACACSWAISIPETNPAPRIEFYAVADKKETAIRSCCTPEFEEQPQASTRLAHSKSAVSTRRTVELWGGGLRDPIAVLNPA